MKKDCFVCDRIEKIQSGDSPYFVAELASGYAAIGDFQYYPGYTVFLSKVHASELHELDKHLRAQFLEDMAKVAEAVYFAFKPEKLNYELLGNVDSHMHWHLFPRYVDDPDPKNPVSIIPISIRNAESTRPDEQQLEILKNKLQTELKRLNYLID